MKTETKTKMISAPAATGLRSAVMRAMLLLAMMLSSVAASAEEIVTYCNQCRRETLFTVISIETEPTCTHEGKKEVWCGNCGNMTKLDIPALGHDWGEWSDTYREPTCSLSGGRLRNCNRCGETEREVPALGHDMSEYTAVSPTCTEQGYEISSCKREGCKFRIRKSFVAALGHREGSDGHCTRCGSLLTLHLDGGSSNATAIGGAHGQTCNAKLSDRTLYLDGDWNTLCLPFNAAKTGPLAGATIMELDTEAAYDSHTTGLDGTTLYLNFKDASDIEAGKPYIVRWDRVFINSEAEWNDFAAQVNSGTLTAHFVLLGADISVSTMAGTSDHPFSGTFDGLGHTLTVSISDTENQGTAPFRYISDATIRNVKVTGTVTGNLHCAGLVGFAQSGTNNIKNCEVAASVVCSGGSHSHCGGILGHGLASATTVSDCLFSGSISGASTATGIIYGWGDGGGTHIIRNCLADGIYTDCSGIELLRKNDGTEVVTKCYKTQDTGSLGIYTTATGSDLTALLGSNWQESGDKAVPSMSTALENIENPTFEGVTINSAEPTAVTSSDGKVSFVGTYSPFEITDANINQILYLGGNNTIGYATAPRTLRPFRAHFVIPVTSSVKGYVLNFGDEGTTGIRNIDNSAINNLQSDGDAWYDLSGRRLNGKPGRAGIYIHNGRRVMVK